MRRRAAAALSFLVLGLLAKAAGADDRVTGAAAAPANLLTNGGFAAGLQGWTDQFGTTAWVASDARGAIGSGSVRIVSPLGSSAAVLQCVTVTAGKTYLLTAAAWLHDGPAGARTSASITFSACSCVRLGASIAVTGNSGLLRK